MTAPARLALLALVLLTAAVTGCGDDNGADSDESQIREQAEQTLEAARTGDYAKTCALAGLPADTCEPKRPAGISDSDWQQAQEATKTLAASTKIEKVTIDGDSATVKLTNSAGPTDLQLEKKNGKWQPTFSVYDRTK